MTEAERARMYSHAYWWQALEPRWGAEEADRLWIRANRLRRDTNEQIVRIFLQGVARRTR